jgi:hypothetical protein
MTAPVYVMPPTLTVHGQPVGPPNELADLLRQLLAAQQEQVALLKAQAATQDGGARWRAFLARWEGEFPGIGAACKQVMPALERAYLTLVRDVTDRVSADPDMLTDEFLVSEFLDRYGVRLGQMANVIGQLAPLADAAPAKETAGG